MSHGIKEGDMQILKDIFSRNLEQGIVILYGSRARGTDRLYSDVDLVVKSAAPASVFCMEEVRAQINEESDFPYLCDVQLYDEIQSPAMRARIDNEARILFTIPDGGA